MGVHGLTTYIAKNADKYLEPHELHDCNLVIDGDSLASNLYKSVSECNSAFGGDYDKYYRTVRNFFALLQPCNIHPYVLLDGGYERRKLRTVRERLRSKIGAIKHINPVDCLPMFPLLMREVFVEAAVDSGVSIMRCFFEADDEIARLARKLNCPVLSYDSDFYIHNVQYIPFPSVTLRCYKRVLYRPPVNGRKTKTKHNKVAVIDLLSGELMEKQRSTVPGERSYHFLDSCLYKMENLARNVDKNLIPLLATLLGNDYIHRSVFRKFFTSIKLPKSNKNLSCQQRRITALLRWLQHETLESAIEKIVSRMDKERKVKIEKQIRDGIECYCGDRSFAFDYFELNEDDLIRTRNGSISEPESESDDEESLSGEEEVDSVNESTDEETENESEPDPDDEQVINEPIDDHRIPEWIRDKILQAKLPRFVVDLIALKMYVNSPQIENFLFTDCNQIAHPILRYIFTLVHHPNRVVLQYLTRVKAVTNVHYLKLQCFDDVTFDSDNISGHETFEYILSDFDDRLEILSAINQMPDDIQLFILSIIYWSRRSTLIGKEHVHSLIICLICLKLVDPKVGSIRCERQFNHLYAGRLSKIQSEPKLMEKSIDTVRFPDEIEEVECLLVHQQVLPYYGLSKSIRNKHTTFSSTILHVFSEFQSIILHLNCLNGICNGPFEPIKISDIYNGTFLYNMYSTLIDRQNIDHYVKHHVLRDAPNLYDLYGILLSFCEKFVPCMAPGRMEKFRKKRLRNVRKKIKRKQKVEAERLEGMVAGMETVDVEEYEDLDNKFYVLNI